MVSATGASVGLVSHSLFAAAGLSALLTQSAVAFSAVKYAGAAYLIFLASGRCSTGTASSSRKQGRR